MVAVGRANMSVVDVEAARVMLVVATMCASLTVHAAVVVTVFARA